MLGHQVFQAKEEKEEADKAEEAEKPDEPRLQDAKIQHTWCLPDHSLESLDSLCSFRKSEIIRLWLHLGAKANGIPWAKDGLLNFVEFARITLCEAEVIATCSCYDLEHKAHLKSH